MHHVYPILAFALFAAAGLPALAAEAEFTLLIKDHRFQPAEIRVPAGERVKLVVDNRDPTQEEFESHDLRREKVVYGNSRKVIWIGPLPKGEYEFFGEYHEDTAKGTIVAE